MLPVNEGYGEGWALSFGGFGFFYEDGFQFRFAVHFY